MPLLSHGAFLYSQILPASHHVREAIGAMKTGVRFVHTMRSKVNWTLGRSKTHFLRWSRSRFRLLSWLLYFDRLLDWLRLLDGLWVRSPFTSTSWPGLSCFNLRFIRDFHFLTSAPREFWLGRCVFHFIYTYNTLLILRVAGIPRKTPVRLHIDCMGPYSFHWQTQSW